VQQALAVLAQEPQEQVQALVVQELAHNQDQALVQHLTIFQKSK
jgi:hypothetical protein